MKKFLLLFTLFIAFGIAGCGDVANDIKNGDVTNPTKLSLDDLIGEYSIVDMNIDGSSITQPTTSFVKINTKDYNNVMCSIDAYNGTTTYNEVLYSDNIETFLNSYISASGNNVIFSFSMKGSKIVFTLQKKSKYTADQGVGKQGEVFGLTVNNGNPVSKVVSEVPITLNHMTNKNATVIVYFAEQIATDLYTIIEPAMIIPGSETQVVNPDFSEVTQTSTNANTTQYTAKTRTGQLTNLYYLVEAESSDGVLTYGFFKVN